MSRACSRNGKNFTTRFPTITKALEELPRETVIDGEIVAVGSDGRPSFSSLQNADGAPVLFYAFDLPLGGVCAPLRGRRGFSAFVQDSSPTGAPTPWLRASAPTRSSRGNLLLPPLVASVSAAIHPVSAGFQAARIVPWDSPATPSLHRFQRLGGLATSACASASRLRNSVIPPRARLSSRPRNPSKPSASPSWIGCPQLPPGRGRIWLHATPAVDRLKCERG